MSAIELKKRKEISISHDFVNVAQWWKANFTFPKAGVDENKK